MIHKTKTTDTHVVLEVGEGEKEREENDNDILTSTNDQRAQKKCCKTNSRPYVFLVVALMLQVEITHVPKSFFLSKHGEVV